MYPKLTLTLFSRHPFISGDIKFNTNTSIILLPPSSITSRMTILKEMNNNNRKQIAKDVVVEEDDDERPLLVKFNNKLYDIKKFASKHPGGRKVLEKVAGSKIDKFMKGEERIMGVRHEHSEAAFEMLERYSLDQSFKVCVYGRLLYFKKLAATEPLINYLDQIKVQILLF